MHEPPAIFLDEPTTGVDPISRREIWTLVNEMVKQDGLTVFLTTSYMDEAERCHEVVLMHRGRIIAQGSPSELPGALDGSFAEIAVAGMEEQQSALRALKRMPGIRSAYPLGEKIGCVYTETSCEAIRRYAEGEGARVESVSEASPCLEDVFLSKISEEGDAVDESALEEFFFEGEGSGAGGCEKREVMIETQNLEKRFGSFVAVDDLTFSIKSGEIFGFLGPNGAGKTTTIKMLCGLFPPTSGRGTIGGLDFFKEQFKIKKSIGYMSQKFSLYRDLTVEENIVLYGGIYGVPRKELARRKGLILKMAGLSGEGDAITGELPMGIKQRLALGCAIIHKPPCIFLDEPTSGVDPAARRQFWDIIYLLSRRMGVTVLVTTHYMDEAEHCDRLSLMTRGKLVALGHPSELKGRVSKDIGKLLEICTPDPFSAVDCLRGEYRHCFVFGAGVHLYTSDPKREALRIKSALEAHGVEVSGIGEGAIPFEDVFVYFCENVEG